MLKILIKNRQEVEIFDQMWEDKRVDRKYERKWIEIKKKILSLYADGN